jgi:hypothetical protein
MRGDVMAFTKDLPVKTRAKGKENVEPMEPVEDVLPPPPVLERETTEAPETVPVKPKPRKKAIKKEIAE